MTVLLTPGPVYVCDEIRLAQAQDIIHHRTKAYEALHKYIADSMKRYLNADHVLLICSSGTGALEAAVSGTVHPEDKMIIFANGNFGRKLIALGQSFCQVEEHHLPEGQGFDLAKTKEFIDKTDAKYLGILLNETDAGVANKIGEICKYAKQKGMTTIVDSISGFPTMPLDMKADGVDFAAVATQKGLGCPPGMAILGVSEHGYKLAQDNPKPQGYYFGLKRFFKMAEKNQTPNTPPVTTMQAIKRSVEMIEAMGGIKAFQENQLKWANWTREQITGMGLKLMAEPGFESNTLTSFYIDNADPIKDELSKEYGLEVAGSKEFKGKVLRIAHAGHFQENNLKKCLTLLKMLHAKYNAQK